MALRIFKASCSEYVGGVVAFCLFLLFLIMGFASNLGPTGWSVTIGFGMMVAIAGGVSVTFIAYGLKNLGTQAKPSSNSFGEVTPTLALIVGVMGILAIAYYVVREVLLLPPP